MERIAAIGGTYFGPLITKFRKLLVILVAGDWSWFRGLSVGVAAAIEHEAVLRNLACNTVVDIGANRGQFALIARHCMPTAHLISFEPLPLPAAAYRNIFANDRKAVLYQVAISDTQAQSVMHVSAQDASSSLLPLTARQQEIFPGTSEVGTLLVQTRPLDACVTPDDIRAPAMLKLDVQGFELNALKGCESLLARFAYVYVECSFIELYRNQALAHEVIKYLDSHNFQLASIHNMQYDRTGKEIQADFLFTRGTIP